MKNFIGDNQRTEVLKFHDGSTCFLWCLCLIFGIMGLHA